MKHTLLYIALALASFTLQPATVQAKVQKDSKGKKEADAQLIVYSLQFIVDSSDETYIIIYRHGSCILYDAASYCSG